MYVMTFWCSHMAIRVVPKSQHQLRHLASLQSSTALDFLSPPSKVDRPVDICVSPDNYYDVARSLAQVDLSHSIYVTDLGQLIREEEQSFLLRRVVYGEKAFDLQNYHQYSEVS